MRELGHSVTLVNRVDSRAAKAWASNHGLVRMKHILLTYMFAQDTGTLLCCTSAQVAESSSNDEVAWM